MSEDNLDDGANDDGADDSGNEGNEGSDDSSEAWPETWRQDWAGENEKMAEHLSRYASPSAALTAGYSANLKISSGEYKSTTPFPEKGTDEEKTAWRNSSGIPETFDKYEVGREVDKGDQPVSDRFLEFAHGKNASPESVKTAIEWFYHDRDVVTADGFEEDAKVATEAEDVLRAEWGDEYRSNINRVEGLLDTAPEGVKDMVMNARVDGVLLKSIPGVQKFLIDMALQINPATTLVPGAGDNIAGAITDELGNLKKMMGNRNSDYWKGPKAEKNQERYKQLLEAQMKMKK